MALFGLDLANGWRIILRRKWIILCIFLAVFLFNILFTNRQSPVYLAKTTIEVKEPKAIGELILRDEWGEELDMKKEVRFINSPQFRKEVIRRLAPTPEQTTLEQVKGISRGLPGGIIAQWVERSNVIEISATASKPEVARELANIAAEVYIDLNLREKTEKARSFRQSLEIQLIKVKTRLDHCELALKDFKEREGNIALEKKESENTLMNLELKLSDILQRYPRQSPMVKELKGQIETLQNQLKVLVSKELELKYLTRNFEFELKRYNDWKNRVTAARITEEVEIPAVSIVDAASVPKSPISSNKVMNGFVGALAGLMIGVFFVFVLENLESPLRTIEEVESFMQLPVLGVIPCLSTKKHKEKFWLRLNDIIKRRKKLTYLREQLIIYYSVQSPIAESYRILRTSIQFSAQEKQAKVFLVTSTTPREGKTITCANLALTFAQAGQRVLLVDADLRRPILDKLFGLERQPGLVDCLQQTKTWQEAQHTITDILLRAKEWEQLLSTPALANLNLITAGKPAANPAELLSSAEFKTLVQEFKANFDFILFDSPPIFPIADTAILAPCCDGVILVYQTGRIPKEAFMRAKQHLASAGAPLAGIVLNNVSRATQADSSYAYYRYKDYNYK